MTSYMPALKVNVRLQPNGSFWVEATRYAVMLELLTQLRTPKEFRKYLCLLAGPVSIEYNQNASWFYAYAWYGNAILNKAWNVVLLII